MDILVPFLSVVVGGGLALVGAWMAQLMTKKRELELDERRAMRAREVATQEWNRKLLLDVAEYAQNFESRLAAFEEPFARGGRAADIVHRDLLTARLRTQNDPLMIQVWKALVLTQDWVEGTIAQGDIDTDQISGEAVLDSDRFFMIGGHVAVEAVMLAVTALLGPDEYRPLFGPVARAIAGQVESSFEYIRSADTQHWHQHATEAARRLRTVLETSRQAALAQPVSLNTVRETVAQIEAVSRMPDAIRGHSEGSGTQSLDTSS